MNFFRKNTEGVFFLLILSLSTLCKAQTNDTLVVVSFGNSTTALRKNIKKVYSIRLNEALSTAGIPAKVMNAGIGGSHSGSINDNNFHKIRHAKDRFETDVLNQNANWVIIAFGINDAWQDKGKDSASRISLGKYIENLSFFITEIEKKQGNPILMTPNPIGKKYETWRFEKLKDYAEATKALAQKKNIPLVDVWGLFQKNAKGIDDLLLDGMHPNDKGHQLMADALFEIIHFNEKKPKNALNTEGGKITNDSIWLADKVEEIKDLRMGPFIKLTNGDLLTVDTTNSYISHDNGKTWAIYPIFKEPAKFEIRPERALICTKNGIIILAFANDKERTAFNWDNEKHDLTNDAKLPTYTIRSFDDGKTWTDLQKLHDDWTGAIRDIIETKDGSIVFTSMMFRKNPGHHTTVTYTSKNEGKTWTRSNIIDLGGTGHHSGVIESTLTQLKDGHLWLLMRTNWGKLWEAFSSDDGLNWRDFKATSIDASSAPPILKRLKSGRLALVWNRYYPEGKTEYPLRGGDKNWSEVPVSNHREELSIMFSEDEGKNWTKPVVFAKTLKHKGQISYPYLYENTEGVLWITTMFGGLRVQLKEQDFIKKKR